MRSYCGQCSGTDGWCGACYEVKRGRISKNGASRPSAKVVPEETSRISVQEVSVSHIDNSSIDSWRDRYPHLWTHLVQGRDADGLVRQTSTLLVFLEGGRLKLCLHDRVMNLVAFLTVSGLPEGFAELEDGLARCTLAWRKKKKIS